MNRFLLIAMAFPPKGVVGSLRTYRLCKYLPELGWLPEVITTKPWGIVNRDCTLVDQLPQDIRVHRTPLIDPYLAYQRRKAAKTSGSNGAAGQPAEAAAGSLGNQPSARKPGGLGALARRIKRGLFGLVTTPDHMVFWNLHLLVRGCRILRGNKDIHFIFTSTPPHSSLLAGMVLSRLFRLPHVVDLRDPWGGRYWGEHSAVRRWVERTLERAVIRHATRVISSTDGYSRMTRERFPHSRPEKFVTITNCFEPEKFDRIVAQPRDKFTLCYLGIVYPIYNPYPFFTALRDWLAARPEIRPDVQLILVGSGDPDTSRVIRDNGLEDIVTITGRIAHEQAIAVTKSAHLLLLLMGITDKAPRDWLPAKLFEYLACRKPILAYATEGEALSIIRSTGAGHTVTSDDPAGFIKVLDLEYRAWREGGNGGEVEPGIPAEIEKYTSDYTNRQFADLFDSLDREP